LPVRRHVGRAVPGPRAHAEVLELPPVRGPRRRHYALESMTHAWRFRPVPRGHNTLAPARAAFRHWPSLRRTSPPPCAHAEAPVDHDGEAEPPLQVPEPINPPSPSLARPSNRANRRRPPLTPPVNSSLRSCPGQTSDPLLFPSTHLSPQAHVMA
jgi:hypothetical protein